MACLSNAQVDGEGFDAAAVDLDLRAATWLLFVLTGRVPVATRDKQDKRCGGGVLVAQAAQVVRVVQQQRRMAAGHQDGCCGHLGHLWHAKDISL